MELAGYVYVPIKDVYTVVNENGVSYAGGYLTSIEILVYIDVRYQKLFKYNIL